MGILINQGRQIGGLSEQDQANIGKVKQTETTTGADYELLFSETAADATTHTEEARKSQYFKFNPSGKTLKIKDQYDNQTIIKSDSINVDGDKTASMYSGSIVHGFESKTESSHSYAGGYQTQAKGYASHAEGYGTLAGTGQGAHAEGQSTTASGTGSHAEGQSTTASGSESHAEGNYTTASGSASHAEGNQTSATGTYSHAEGHVSGAFGYASHAEGSGTAGSRSISSKGSAAHAEGWVTFATEDCSHAEGLCTYASSAMQHVQGKFNVKDENDVYAHIVGNGTAEDARSNAYALRWNGQQDVTNDIVRVDSGGTWDGFNASLEDAFKQNLGECNNYDADTGTYYNFYEIAEIVVDPGTAEDSYEHQKDICNPIIFEVSQIVNSSWADTTGYSVLELAFKFNTTTNETELLQFLSSNSLDYKILKDDNDSTIWHLYGQYCTQSGTRYDNKSILHHVTGSGFNNNITVVMQTVLDYEKTVSILNNGIAPTRNFVKTSASKLFVRNSAIANNYNSSATYEVGDLCFYQSTPYSNVLYVCNTAISTPEDFNSSHWTQVTLPEYFVKKSGDTMTGQLNFSNNNVANIVVPARALSYINPSGNAGIYAKKDLNVDQWYPAVCMDTKSGGHWQIGNYNNDNLQFVFGTKANRDANNNQVSIFNLVHGNPGTAYTIAHSGNVSTGDSNGQVKIAGTNVSVKGLGSRAYDSTAYLPLAGGTCTGDVYFKKKIDVTNWSNFRGGLWTTSLSVEGGVEIGYSTPYIDFHYNKDTHDYTHRVICSSVGNWDFLSKNTASTQAWVSTILNAEQFKVRSSIHIKENIKDIEEDEALKLLELRPVSFDYKDRADGKDQRGLIAEEVMDILPNTVLIPEGYTEFDPKNPNNVPGIDYSKFVPYLIKLCQIQQNQINTLAEKLDNLNKN